MQEEPGFFLSTQAEFSFYVSARTRAFSKTRNNVNESTNEDSEIATLRAQVLKLQFDKKNLETKQATLIAREVALGLKTIQVPPNQQSNPSGVFQFSNPLPNSQVPPSSTPSSFPNAPPSKLPVHTSGPPTLDSLSQALERLSGIVENNIVNGNKRELVERRVDKISKDPPIYSRKTHGSMRKFGRKQFAWWMRGQCMSSRQSVQFFCLCFGSDIERAHVDKIALDINGNPKFGSVQPLIERVIEDLQFDEETGEQLRLKFDLFRAHAGTKLDAEFMRCIELREEGWPSEGDVENYRNARYHFSRRLALGDDFSF